MSKEDKIKQFNHAAESNFISTVKIMVNNNEIDPSRYNNSAIKKAHKNGNLDIVKFLLNNSKVQKTISGYDLATMLNSAISSFNFDMIDLITNNPKINYDYYDSIRDILFRITEFIRHDLESDLSKDYIKILLVLDKNKHFNKIFKSEFNDRYQTIIVKEKLHKKITAF